MIRILHEVTSMDTGGAETLLMNIYRNINRDNIQFDFMTHRQTRGFYDDEIEKLGGIIYRGNKLNPFHMKQYYAPIVEVFKKQKYQIFHAHNSTSMFALKKAKQYQIPVRIIHCHSSRQLINYKLPIKLYCRKNNLKYATDTFGCSKKAVKYLFGKENLDKTVILKNGIDVKKFEFSEAKREKIRKEYGISEKFVIGHVGRLSRPKNHFYLFKVFKEYKKINSNACLMLVGKGELEGKLRKLAKKYNIEKDVIFCGPHANVEEYYMAMDLFVFPSLYEGFGNVVIEAQATGLPCIISDVIPEDVEITNLVTKISLKEKQKWIQKIQEIKCLNLKTRKAYNNQVLTSGYDIKEVAKFMEEYYTKKYEEVIKNETNMERNEINEDSNSSSNV